MHGKNDLHSFQLPNSGYVDRYFFGSFIQVLPHRFCLNWQQMVLDLWETSRMKHLVKNYHCRHSSKQSVKKLKDLYDQSTQFEVQ